MSLGRQGPPTTTAVALWLAGAELSMQPPHKSLTSWNWAVSQKALCQAEIVQAGRLQQAMANHLISLPIILRLRHFAHYRRIIVAFILFLGL